MKNTRSNNSSKRYAINASSSVLTLLIQITVLVWVNQHLIRRIPAEEYALYPVIVSLLVAGDIFAKIFTGGVSRFIVAKDAERDADGLVSVTSSMVPMLAGACVVVALFGSLGVWKVDVILDVDPAYVADARMMLALLILKLCANIVTTPFVVGLFARQRFVVLNMVELGAEFAKTISLMVLLFGFSTRVIWLIVASTISSMLSLALRRYFTKKDIPEIRFQWSKMNIGMTKEILRFGAWTSTSGVANLLQKTGPFLLLNHFGAAVETVIFHLGRLVDHSLRRFVRAAAVPLQPALTRRYVTKGIGGFRELYYKGGRYFLWVVLFAVPPLVVFRNEIITLYVGLEYAGAGVVMLLYFMVYPFDYAGMMFYRVAYALGRVGEFSKIELYSTIIMFLGMVGAVVFYGAGAIGIAAVSLVAAVVKNIGFMWPRGLRLVGGDFRTMLASVIVPGCAPCGVAFAVCVLARSVYLPTGWSAILCFSLLSAIIYGVVVYFYSMRRVERESMNRILGRLAGTFGRLRLFGTASRSGKKPGEAMFDGGELR